jgi:eukaryotic-like serine/threonine-protein kinase
MPADPRQVKAIFLAAVAMATPEERAAFLRAACGDDEGLRRRVDELLRAHDDPGGLLPGVPDRAPSDEDRRPPAPAVAESPGTRTGPDQLPEPIGEGGMAAQEKAAAYRQPLEEAKEAAPKRKD